MSSGTRFTSSGTCFMRSGTPYLHRQRTRATRAITSKHETQHLVRSVEVVDCGRTVAAAVAAAITLGPRRCHVWVQRLGGMPEGPAQNLLVDLGRVGGREAQ